MLTNVLLACRQQQQAVPAACMWASLAGMKMGNAQGSWQAENGKGIKVCGEQIRPTMGKHEGYGMQIFQAMVTPTDQAQAFCDKSCKIASIRLQRICAGKTQTHAAITLPTGQD